MLTFDARISAFSESNFKRIVVQRTRQFVCENGQRVLGFPRIKVSNAYEKVEDYHPLPQDTRAVILTRSMIHVRIVVKHVVRYRGRKKRGYCSAGWKHGKRNK